MVDKYSRLSAFIGPWTISTNL